MQYLFLFTFSILCTSFSYAQTSTTDGSAKNTISTSADTSAQNITQQYKKINLADFINNNQLPAKMIKAKQRLMLPPSPIQFNANIMQAPKAGKFSLVYDALQLWPSEQPLPEISHSAFIQAGDNKVIAVYVAKSAAVQMQQLIDAQKKHKTKAYKTTDSTITTPVNSLLYAMHIYNYAKGPRLVIIGAQAIDE